MSLSEHGIPNNDRGNGGRGDELDFKPDCAEPSRSPHCSVGMGFVRSDSPIEHARRQHHTASVTAHQIVRAIFSTHDATEAIDAAEPTTSPTLFRPSNHLDEKHRPKESTSSNERCSQPSLCQRNHLDREPLPKRMTSSNNRRPNRIFCSSSAHPSVRATVRPNVQHHGDGGDDVDLRPDRADVSRACNSSWGFCETAPRTPTSLK